MRRLVDPAVLVFVAALIGSLGFHLPLYEALGVLATRLALLESTRAERARAAGEDVEMELVVAPSPVEAAPEDESPSRAVRREQPPRPRQAERREPPPPVVPPAPAPPTPRPRPEPAVQEHAVTQRSRDPNVEPPPDARFAADENNRVEEETVARERNMVTDDPEPEPAPSEREREEAEDPGEEEERIAETADREGDSRRTSPAQPEASEQRIAAVVSTPPAGGTPEQTRPRRGESAPAGREGGGEEARYETITIRDGSGTFVVRRPRAAGAGEGNAGGVAVTGPAGRRRADEGERGGARTGRRPGPIDLRVGYAALEDIVGREALEEERRAYAEHRRSRRRGTDHAESWRRFRAAIENFVPNVRTGNQTALNARASPFAGYTAEVHRRLHGPFHDFLVGIAASGALADPDLETKLEIVINRDGTIHQIGVVRQSGQILFDHGAFAAVHAGAPYPIAPDAILSGDGRVYFRWTFKRVEPFCHQIHAERYILDNAAEGRPARSGTSTPVSTPAGQPHRRAGRPAQLSSGGPT